MIFEALGELVGRAFRLIRLGIDEAFRGMQMLYMWAVEKLEEAEEALTEPLKGFGLKTMDIITAELGPESPEEKMEEATRKMLEAIMRQIREETKAEGEEGLPRGGELAAALRILARWQAIKVAREAAAAAADAVHPVRGINIWEIVAGLVAALPVADILSRIASYPLEAAIYRPWAYQCNEANPTAIPPLTDVLRFTVREVYDPERRRELLAIPTPEEAYVYGAKHGLSKRHVDDYWAAHWELPPVTHLNDMLYRGLIDIDTYKRYIRYHDYDPTMIDKYTGIIYRPYTRVDIRRMWDLAVVTDEEVLENYRWLGYDEEHAKRMLLWTKAFVVARDVRAMYSKGWINAEGAKQMLIDIGIPPERAEDFMKRLVKAEAGERIAKERDLTKSEIIKGAKKQILTKDEAVTLLQDLGYEEWEAEYLLAIHGIVAEGDPQGYWEMKQITELQKKAMGLPYKEVPDEVVEAEKAIAEKKKEIEEKRKRGWSEDALAALYGELSSLEYRLRQLLIAHKLA